MWQNIAFSLIGVGILVLIGWSAQGFFTASDIPLLIRIAVGIIGAGILLLVTVAIRDRYKKSKKESFEEVDR
jgi:membrane protein DedA with SNARE-associated domain